MSYLPSIPTYGNPLMSDRSALTIIATVEGGDGR